MVIIKIIIIIIIMMMIILGFSRRRLPLVRKTRSRSMPSVD